MSDNKSQESFRDHISTVDSTGKRIWVFPKKPSGPWFTKRTILSVFLLIFLFSGPFIRIGDQPLLMLNILERKFIILGNVFWPQDFHLFVFAMITGIVFVILFTVVFGRLFCGWVCPQTIFMEMVFRKIEYAIEGDWKQQIKLNKQPWDKEKIWKKTLKHVIFAIISFAIGNTFLAYIIGSDELFKIITEPIGQHIGGFSAMIIFSGLFYGVFAWMREQVCTTVCPYGRLQGVLLDRNSLVVAYDYTRGEGRAKFRKNEVRSEVGKGDCIDCGACVHVCPTGIDIRNGTQLECINCTACMDACDHMMESVDLKKGLIGYKTEASIADKKEFGWNARIIGYTGVLSVLLVVIITLLVSRSDVETTILRTPGMLFQTRADGYVSNLYNFKIINKTNRDFPVSFKLENVDGTIEFVGQDPKIEQQGVAEGALFVVVNTDHLDGIKTKVEIGVYDNEKLIETVKTNFVGPAN